MKKYLVLILLLLSTVALAQPNPPSGLKACSPTAIRVEPSKSNDSLVWADIDCDGKCDVAFIGVLTPMGWEIQHQLSCEDADLLYDLYQKEVKRQEGY